MGATTTLLRADDGRGRLLVRSRDGRRLGWHDLASGATHLAEDGAGDLVAEAVARYVARTSPLRDRRVAGLVPAPRTAAPVPPAGATRGDLRSRPPAGSSVVRLHDLTTGPAAPTGPARRAARGRWGRRRHPDGVAELLETVVAARAVADVLARTSTAPGPWSVLHDVPVGGDRVVDHLLLGPGGVVVVGSAPPGPTGPAPADVVEDRVRLVREVLGRTEVAATHPRGVAVRGVVVGGSSRRRPAPSGGAPVHLRVADLPRWLADLPRVVSSVDVARTVEALADPTGWPAGA